MSERSVYTSIHIYALAFSFVALLCMVITLGIAAYDIVQITAPTFTYVPQSNYDYEEDRYITEEPTSQVIQLEKMNAARSLTAASIILIIDIALFLYHWKLANRPIMRRALVSA